MASNYFLKLDQFEGPLDLLIHLIKVNEIDIFNIDVLLLTEQYLAYLRLLKFDDLGDAGEFLEMAATLIEIKTWMLLPHDTAKAGDEEGENDPRKSLQDRLIEYERFRSAAEHLSAIPQLGEQICTNHEWHRLSPLYEDVEAPLEGDPASLVVMYEQMLKEFAERKPVAKVEATTHMVSVEEKIEEMQRLLDTLKFVLFQGFYEKFSSRYEFVVYILAMLELTKWGKIRIHQEQINGPIWMHRSDFDASLLPSSRDALVGEDVFAVIDTIVAAAPDPNGAIDEST